jgi:hypothetical protein
LKPWTFTDYKPTIVLLFKFDAICAIFHEAYGWTEIGCVASSETFGVIC